MKPELLNLLVCPACGNQLSVKEDVGLVCRGCNYQAAIQEGIPLFTIPPSELAPSEKLARGPEMGTPWRRANWRFLEQQVARLAPEALILDVGAGRGDFADLLVGRKSIALDIYPYPEVDLVCDLTQTAPFQAGCFDAVLLMNVLEHVQDAQALLSVLVRLLRPGGILILAIPFLVKIHQAPIDYVRYTHYALQRLGEEFDLTVSQLEGYYDPVFLLQEAISNLRWSVLPAMNGGQRYFARAVLGGIRYLSGVLGSTLGGGQARPPSSVRSMAPIGYQIVYQKIQE
jgi:SAM-dependent methyltransferase